MQQCLILGNQRRVKKRKTQKTGRSWGHMMREARQEMAGGVCSRRARRGRKRGKLHNNA